MSARCRKRQNVRESGEAGVPPTSVTNAKERSIRSLTGEDACRSTGCAPLTALTGGAPLAGYAPASAAPATGAGAARS